MGSAPVLPLVSVSYRTVRGLLLHCEAILRAVGPPDAAAAPGTIFPMPDRRRNRGARPQDAEQFAPSLLPTMRSAVDEFSWLLARGYSDGAALKLVGDKHQLRTRQREAVRRASCPASLVEARAAKRCQLASLPAGVQGLGLDGFNLLVTMEAALSGAPLLRSRDGLLRDLSSVHGNYRTVRQTGAAMDLLVRALPAETDVRWYLDKPVSNSGRIAGLLRKAEQTVELVPSADTAIVESGRCVATADGPLIDRCPAWVDLTGPLVSALSEPWVLELGIER